MLTKLPNTAAVVVERKQLPNEARRLALFRRWDRVARGKREPAALPALVIVRGDPLAGCAGITLAMVVGMMLLGVLMLTLSKVMR